VDEHPIRLTVGDDLRRSRLTVFFRLLLALPHLVWLAMWTGAALVISVINWFMTLVRGSSPLALHDFYASYVRYSVHVGAYVFLAANPFPGFTGKAGSYPIDVEIDPPRRQNRWKTGFRAFLGFPALLLAWGFAGGSFGGRGISSFASGGGALASVALLGWFVCLARGRMPRGFRDLDAYGLRYVAQADGYLFLLTDRYPDASPGESPVPGPPPRGPVWLDVRDDLRRSRLTVFFRLLLALPHLLWLLLWGIAAVFAGIVNWFVTLVRGRPALGLHRFLAAYIRYALHVGAFICLVGNPFPGFFGRRGSYPVDVELPGPERQNRWRTGFRVLLAIPGAIVSGGLGGLLATSALLGWFAALVTGRMPVGLRNLGAFALRYSAEYYAFLALLTERYPYSGPWLSAPA
jgi:hypothetical protein